MIVRYLELQLSVPKNEIRFFYTPVDATHLRELQMETFRMTSGNVNLSDSNWHNVSVSVSGREIQVIVDCNVIDKRQLDFMPDRNFSASDVNVFVGERNRNFYFKVNFL